MRRSAGVAIAAGVGLVGIVAPLWISIQLARRQSLASEESRTLSYASDVLRRAEETGSQFAAAHRELMHDHIPPCSPHEIDLMRALDVGSSYIQAVGRVSGNSLICTSLGTTAPIPVGPPDFFTRVGVAERINRKLSIAPDHPLDVLSLDGVAILIDPSLIVDTPTEGPGIAIAVFVPTAPNRYRLAVSGGNLNPAWLKPIPKGSQISYIDGQCLISEIRSPHLDIQVVAAVPATYVNRRVRAFALVFVPIGLLCGAGLVWAVTYIARVNLSLPAVLRAAARRKEFFVEYQPIVELETRRWVGAEALVRWQRSGRIVRPDQFIPAAEESGVITVITQEVAAIVAADLPKLMSLDPDFSVSMNLSAPDLRSARTVGVMKRLLRTSGADPRNVWVEATERGFLQGQESKELLARIRSLGISVAIDDFGTGYSSLACLQTLRLDVLKIDRAFVETVDTDGATSQVVMHIIEMAHSLNLEMVAEGVETEAQAQFLQERGVRYAQGWLFGRPMAVKSLCKEMDSRRAAPATEVFS